MALLEKISSMKQTGMNDSKIANSLMEEGYSPREVSEALSQSKIKAAVSQETPPLDMQPSISSDSQTQDYSSIPNYSQQQTIEAPEQQAQYPAQYQEQYAQQQYPEEAQQGYYQQAIDLETVRDIARQQVEETIKKLKEQVEILSKSKTEMNFHLQDIENRMQKIEAIIQDIQRAVLKRMGEYGEAISGISNEIRATQQSFAKLINPILDNKRGITQKSEEPMQRKQQSSQQQSQKQNQSQENRPRPNQSKNSATFEDYFR